MDFIDEVEEDTKNHIKLGEALQRLRINTDFKLLIEEGYLKNTLLEYVFMKSSRLNDADFQSEIEKRVLAITLFNEFLSTIELNALKAVEQLSDLYRSE